ncbi:WD repeat-containing protein 87 [Quaeritorhiza haematococci]|nr:WD repeat-containing protein 87 [Quaeritorhiza haematococci]
MHVKRVKKQDLPGRIVAVGGDGSVRILSPVTGTVLATAFPVMADTTLVDLIYDPTQDRAWALASNGDIAVYNCESNPMQIIDEWKENAPESFMANDNADVNESVQALIAGTITGQLVMFSLKFGSKPDVLVQPPLMLKLVSTITMTDGYPEHLCYNNVTGVLAVVSTNRRVWFYRVDEREGVQGSPKTHTRDEGHVDTITSIACLESLTLFATASKDGTVKLWDGQESTLVREIQFNEIVWSVCFANERGDLLVGMSEQIALVRMQDYLPLLVLKQAFDRGENGFQDDVFELPIMFDSNLDFWEIYRVMLEKAGVVVQTWHVNRRSGQDDSDSDDGLGVLRDLESRRAMRWRGGSYLEEYERHKIYEVVHDPSQSLVLADMNGDPGNNQKASNNEHDRLNPMVAGLLSDSSRNRYLQDERSAELLKQLDEKRKQETDEEFQLKKRIQDRLAAVNASWETLNGEGGGTGRNKAKTFKTAVEIELENLRAAKKKTETGIGRKARHERVTTTAMIIPGREPSKENRAAAIASAPSTDDATYSKDEKRNLQSGRPRSAPKSLAVGRRSVVSRQRAATIHKKMAAMGILPNSVVASAINKSSKDGQTSGEDDPLAELLKRYLLDDKEERQKAEAAKAEVIKKMQARIDDVLAKRGKEKKNVPPKPQPETSSTPPRRFILDDKFAKSTPTSDTKKVSNNPPPEQSYRITKTPIKLLSTSSVDDESPFAALVPKVQRKPPKRDVSPEPISEEPEPRRKKSKKKRKKEEKPDTPPPQPDPVPAPIPIDLSKLKLPLKPVVKAPVTQPQPKPTEKPGANEKLTSKKHPPRAPSAPIAPWGADDPHLLESFQKIEPEPAKITEEKEPEPEPDPPKKVVVRRKRKNQILSRDQLTWQFIKEAILQQQNPSTLRPNMMDWDADAEVNEAEDGDLQKIANSFWCPGLKVLEKCVSSPSFKAVSFPFLT